MHTRRELLKTFCAAPLLGGMPGSRALVCVFLSGGNDGHNTVVPMDGYESYREARGKLALPQSALLPIKAGREVYGLHPRLRTICRMFRDGRAAIVADVGVARGELSHEVQRKIWEGAIAGSRAQRMELREIAAAIRSGRGGFFLSRFEGFDTHGAQLVLQDRALARLDAALGEFLGSVGTHPVTLFTASEFGRSVAPNSSEGTDHGRSNHHFVIGPGVPGGRIYGAFPRLDEDAPPAISPAQYAQMVRLPEKSVDRQFVGQACCLRDGL